LSLIDVAKRRAAEEALKMVEDGQVIGVGSGTTVEVFLELLKDKLRKEHIRIEAIASSRRIRDLLINMRIPVRTLDEEPEPDLAIDGADEVDLRMNLIKGGGGAHAMEKVIDAAAKKLVIIVDYTKLSVRLCEKKPIPVEVLPEAVGYVKKKLYELGAKLVEVRMCKGGKYGPVVTENGNLILDAHFSPLDEPEKLELEIKRLPGVVEVGLFCGMTDVLIVGHPDRVEVVERRERGKRGG